MLYYYIIVSKQSGMLHKTQLKSQSRSSTNLTLQNPSMMSAKTKQLSKSYVSSKQLTNEQLFNNQIVYYKEKAHQSFMQVIQMQQLHEEELQELRLELQQKQRDRQLQITEITNKQHKIEQLQHRIQQLQSQNATLQSNYKHHACNFEQNDLSIDSIQPISCKDESRLDDSAINNFTQIITFNRHQEQLKSIKQEITKEVILLSNPLLIRNQQNNLLQMIDKLFEYISFLKEEFVKFKLKSLKENKQGQNKKYYQSLQQQSKFMTQHIKRLSAQKMKVEKKLLQTERQLKKSQQKVKKIQNNPSKQALPLDQTNSKQTFSIRLSGQQNTLETNHPVLQPCKTYPKPLSSLIRKIKS